MNSNITVQTNYYPPAKIVVDQFETVGDIKERVREAEGWHPSRLRLHYCYKEDMFSLLEG